MQVGFRPLRREDFPQLGRWLEEPLIAWWWADDPALESLEEEYGSAIDGDDPSEVFIVTFDGSDAGLIQRYRWEDEPESVAEVAPFIQLPPGAMSLDYLLADGARGGGRGTAMVAAFMDDLWRAHPDCPCVIVPVNADNKASWRILERNGFRLIATCDLEPDHPDHNRAHVVYRIDRSG